MDDPGVETGRGPRPLVSHPPDRRPRRDGGRAAVRVRARCVLTERRSIRPSAGSSCSPWSSRSSSRSSSPTSSPTDLTRPLRSIASAVDRVSAGDLSTPIQVPGDDELARLAESHNRLAADLERRNREVAEILAAIADVSVRDGVTFLVARGAAEAKRIFDLPRPGCSWATRTTFPSRRSCPARRARSVRSCGPATSRSGCSWAGCRHPALGTRRPGPARAVRQRDRGRDPQRPAVRAGRGPERPAPRARRGEGRLPARGQPQPPDAADQHPGLRGPASARPTGSPARRSSRSSPSGCHAWSASS